MNYYARTVGGNWTTAATWSTDPVLQQTGAAATVPPTLADDTFLVNGSGNVVMNDGALFRSLDCTGYTGTLTLNAPTTVPQCAGGFKLVPGMTFTVTAGNLNFVATTDNGGVGWGITTAGKPMPSTTFNGVGGRWKHLDAYTTPSTRTVVVTNGFHDTNDQSISCSAYNTANTNTGRTLRFGTSVITCTLAGAAFTASGSTASTLTLDVASSTIVLTGAGASFNGSSGALIWGTIQCTGSGLVQLAANTSCVAFSRIGTAVKGDGLQINSSTAASGLKVTTGALTLAGNSATNRLIVQSSTVGSLRSVVSSGSLVVSNADFMDISGEGTVSWDLSAITGGSGDCGGNVGITFTTSATQTWQGGLSGNWSDVTKWTSRVPLPQDDVNLGVAYTGSPTITTDMPRLGRNISWAGATGNIAWNVNIAATVFGSIDLTSLVTLGSANNTWTFGGRGSHTFKSAGATWGKPLIFQGPSGTYTLQDALSINAQSLSVLDGTVVTNSFSVTSSGLFSNSNRAAMLTLGTSLITITGATPTVNVSGGLTIINAGTSELVYATAGAGTKVLTLGATANFYKVTYTVAASTGQLQINQASVGSFLDTLSIGPNRSVQLLAGRSLHVRNPVLGATAGNLVTLTSSVAGVPATISKRYVDSQGNVCSFFGTAVAKDGYLSLPGVSGTYVSVPDSSALSITSDIDLRALVALDDWTPAVSNLLVCKETTTLQRSYWFYVNATGALQIMLSTTGTDTPNAQASVLPAVTDGGKLWVRVTWRQSDGRVQFFTADPSLTAPSGADWVQLGIDRTLNAGVPIFDSTSSVEFGSRDAGVNNLTSGKFYKAEIRSGIDGTLVASPDFTSRTYNVADYVSLTDSSAIGMGEWRARQAVNVSGNTGWVFDDSLYFNQLVRIGGVFKSKALRTRLGGVFLEKPLKAKVGASWLP